MQDTQTPGGLGSFIQNLNDKVDAVYRHNLLLDSYSARIRDYGEGCIMSEIEAHTLSFICQEGETTVTGLAANTFRTKGTASKLLKKLEDKGYISRTTKGENKKWIYFTPTTRGRQVNEIHRSYDRIRSMEMIEALLVECTAEEIESFFKVTQARVRYLEETMQQEKQLPSGDV